MSDTFSTPSAFTIDIDDTGLGSQALDVTNQDETTLDPTTMAAGGPVAAPPPNGQGLQIHSWFNVYFDRLILIPSRIDAGTILNDLTYEVTAYFAFSTIPNVTLTSIDQSDPSLTLTGKQSGKISAGMISTYRLDIDGESDNANVNEEMVWNLDNGESAILVITGDRTVLFPFPAQAGADEVFTYKTAIELSYSREDRYQLKSLPDQEYRINIRLNAKEQEEFERLMHTRAKNVWGVPLWHEARFNTAPIAATDRKIYVDTTLSTFDQSTAVVLYDGKNLSSNQIETLDDTSVTMKGDALLSGNAGTIFIMPVRNARLKNGISGTVDPGRQGSHAITFKIENPNRTTDAAKVTLNDIEVLLRPTLVNVGMGVKHEYETYSNGILAKPRYYLKKQGQDNTLEMSWILYTAEDRRDARTLIDRLAGQYTKVYVPTYRADIPLYETLETGQLQFRSLLLNRDELGPLEAVMFRDLTTGAYELKPIESETAPDIDGIITFSINTPTLQDFTPENTQVCELRPYRGDSDSLTLKHYPGRSEITFTLKEITQ